MIKYLAPEESSGGLYSVSFDDYYTQNMVTTTPRSSVVTRDLGIVSLKDGTHSLRIAPVKIARTELMKLL